jgi:hypothetical protein
MIESATQMEANMTDPTTVAMQQEVKAQRARNSEKSKATRHAKEQDKKRGRRKATPDILSQL